MTRWDARTKHDLKFSCKLEVDHDLAVAGVALWMSASWRDANVRNWLIWDLARADRRDRDQTP
jgi:hypothetical protein